MNDDYESVLYGEPSGRCHCCGTMLTWPEYPLNRTMWELELAAMDLPYARAFDPHRLWACIRELARMGWSYETARGLAWNADFCRGEP